MTNRSDNRNPGDVPARALAMIAALAAALLCAGFLVSGHGADSDLPVVIRSVMTSNPSLCYCVDGSYCDWIELMNASDAPVDLKGWKLTDTGDLRGAYTFDSHVLEAGASLIVYCDRLPAGYEGDALFTGFRLSSDGEMLLLADASQHLSVLNVPAMAKGAIYRRDDDGLYSIVPYEQAGPLPEGDTTPSFDPKGVMISEVMPRNRATLADGDGDFSDWIELYNGGKKSVNLNRYALTDSERVLRKWVFPAVTLKPGEYLVVFASDKNRRTPGQELHTNFRLSGKGECVRLSDPDGRVISQIEYDSADADQSLTRDISGAVTELAVPSPGTAQGSGAPGMTNELGLYINEVCAGGIDGDWVELYNRGDATIDLEGIGLSDDPGKPRRWQFPADAYIRPGCYLVIAFCSQRSADSTLTPDYTVDMKLSAGETVCLATPDGRVIDRMTIPAAAEGSAGRAEGMDALRWFAQSTPGEPNAGASYAKVSSGVVFSPAGGLVDGDSVTVTLSADPGVPIYYTTDGTEPTTASPVYSRPITITQTTCLRCVTAQDDVMLSPPSAATYIFTPHTLRVVCVSGDPYQLLGDDGLLNTGAKDGNTDVYLEIYEPDGARVISQPCHLTLTGHNTRINNSQKSFKLNARRVNGDTRFRAALFSGRDWDKYKVLLMRCSGQDFNRTHMLDSVLTALMKDTWVMYQETEVCVLYVNGYYWGVYNMREHIDRHSVAQKEGWSDIDSVNIVQGSGDKISASAGKSDDYKKLIAWVGKNDLSNEENLRILRENMVIESYLDYVIMQMYTCNQDLSNIRAYRSLTEDKRWRYAIYDFDLSYRLNAENYVDDWFTKRAGTITGQDTTLFRALMQNSGVVDYFLTRFGELLATNYASENVVARIRARRDLIRDEMALNCQRWSWDIATWESEVDRIIDYAKVRPGIIIGYLCETFNLSDAQKQQYFGAALAKIKD